MTAFAHPIGGRGGRCVEGWSECSVVSWNRMGGVPALPLPGPNSLGKSFALFEPLCLRFWSILLAQAFAVRLGKDCEHTAGHVCGPGAGGAVMAHGHWAHTRSPLCSARRSVRQGLLSCSLRSSERRQGCAGCSRLRGEPRCRGGWAYAALRGPTAVLLRGSHLNTLSKSPYVC